VSRLPEATFFLQHNPEYARGDELVCLAQLRVVDILRTLMRLSWRRWRVLWRGK